MLTSQGTLFSPGGPLEHLRQRSAVEPGGAWSPASEDRYYQREALYGGRGFMGIYKALNEHGGGLAALPTGTGKTRIFSRVAEARVRSRRRVLVLEHTIELVDQTATAIIANTNLTRADIGIEQASRRALPTARVVVASIQSLAGKRLQAIAHDAFDTIICDECDRGVAPTYRALYEHIANAERLGVTATPDRHDGQGILKTFKVLAYAYELRDAIGDRFLVPIRARMVFVESIDLSAVKSHHGDLDEGQLDEVLVRAEALHGIAKPTVELTGDRPTLVFANSVSHAHALAAAINCYAPAQAIAIDGGTDREIQRHTLQSFKRGDFRFLVNCDLLTRGIDIPPVAAVVMARPTESRPRYAQCVGRGTRLLGGTWEASVAAGKSDVVVIDFVGNAGRHRLVCALDMLDGSIDEKVKKRAVKYAEEGDVDVAEALEQAEREEVVQQRLDLVASVRYRVVDVLDQFALLGVRPRPGRWGGAAITEGQLGVLQKAKIKGADKLDRGQASAVIDALVERRRLGLCTLPMASMLLRKGINPDLTFERARAVLDAIAANNWRGVPASLLESDPTLVLSADAMAQKRKALGV